MGQLSFVKPSRALVHIKVRLKERINGLHGNKHLKRIQVSLVLERHGWETNSVIISDTVIEEKTLDTD